MGAFELTGVDGNTVVTPQELGKGKKKKKKEEVSSEPQTAFSGINIPKDPMVGLKVEKTHLKGGQPWNHTYKDMHSTVLNSDNANGMTPEGNNSPEEIIADEMDNMAQDDVNASIITFRAGKGVHGKVTSDNKYEHVGGDVSTSGFATLNEVDITYGKGETNTQVSFCSDLEYLHKKSRYSSEMPSEDTANNIKTRSAEGDEPEPPTPPPHNMTIDDTKSYDIFVGHNRPFNIRGIKGTLGLGGDFHYHDSGDNIYGTVRAIVQPKNGIVRCSFDSTRRSVENPSGGRDEKIENRFRVKFLNNEDSVVKESYSEEAGDDSGSGTERTEVNVIDKGQFETIFDDKELGLKYSYILRDYGGFDSLGNYDRFRIYGGAGVTDDTSGDKDKVKFMASAVCKYENDKTNGDYTNAEIDLGYGRTVQHGTHPQDIAFGKALFSAKRGKHTLTSSANYLWANDTKLGFADLTYGFDISKNINFGANASYVKGKQSGMDVNYKMIAAKVTCTF